MKKKISLLLCGLMIMALAGCGEAEVDDNTKWLEDSGVWVEFSEVEILGDQGIMSILFFFSFNLD